MRKVALFVAVVMTAMLAVKTVRAADQAGPKFGYVSFQRVLGEADEIKKNVAQLKTDFDAKQKDLDGLSNQMKALQADLEKQRLILSADALKDKEDEFRKKAMDYQQKVGKYTEEINMKRSKMEGEAYFVVADIVNSIGEKEGYTFIMEKSQFVLYSPASSDLTDRVIKEFNAMPKDKKDKIIKNAQASMPQPAKGGKVK